MIAEELTLGQGYTLIGLVGVVVAQLVGLTIVGVKLLRAMIAANAKLANKVGESANAVAVNSERIDNLREAVSDQRGDIRNVPALTVDEIERRNNRKASA
jgi:hypothetical protein